MPKFDERMTVDIDDDIIIDWVKNNKNPEDIFPEKELRDWAEANGYVEEE